ncbi:MAG: Fe-S cluster assembly ATPase SufC [Candidatus Margulisbacteria bacterium]|nr:Fe-S cluster assembly ATPase SufC [Candidatus Margulisiibacteriota bacterium]
MLSIKNLYVRVDGSDILKDFSLVIGSGEVHAIMGPNGAGKSTLAKALSGHPDYEIVSGEVNLDGQDLLALDAAERAQLGLFMSFQYPVEIPGVNNASFLRMAYNAKRKVAGQAEVDPMEFEVILQKKLELLKIDESFLERAVNHGFSGGEKKRNEILQMAILDPKLAILDETDSGLDIDSLRIVAEAVNALRDSQNSFLLITHYQRLLNYIKPDFVHVMVDGRIVQTGPAELALVLEEKGYDGF